MPFSTTSTASTAAGLDNIVSTSVSSPSTLKEIYTVNIPTNGISITDGDIQGKQGEPAADLGMTYSVFRYNPQVYSSYSTLKDWAGDHTLRPATSGVRGLPFPFASSTSSSFEEEATANDGWNKALPVNERAIIPNMAHISTFDTTFGWYETTVQGHRSSSIMDMHQYPDGLAAREAQRGPATEPGNIDNYIFFPANLS
jgi:hypothetical protein